MREAAIRVKNLYYRYPEGTTPALEDISFEVRSGEVFLLAGETGSGKSTLISVLCGLIPRESGGEFSGKVEVLGRQWPVAPGEIFPEVAVSFQNPAEYLLAETVFAEVAFGLENLGFSPQEIRKRVAEALESVNLCGFEDRRLSELSGGERQRVALAAALAVKPRLLLLDEPLAQLDPQAAHRVMTILRALANNGLTVILAEHRLDLALGFTDRVCFLEGGRVAFCGPSKDFPPPARKFPLLPRAHPGKVLISLRDLAFARPGKSELFRGITLDFRAGERVALLGPNGCGKTTFLHLLAGLLEPTAGWIEIRTKPPTGSLLVGLLLQDPDLMLVRESVYAELAFTPENLGLSEKEIRHRVELVAEKLALSDFLDRVPFSLSRGQRLRVALGSVITGYPRILLLDEPTTAQDPRNTARLLATLSADLVIFSTHDEEVARVLATRILCFENGKIREIKK